MKTYLIKISVLPVVLLSCAVSLSAQAKRTWQWVRQLGGDSWDISAGVVSDSKENLYVAGSYFNDFKSYQKNIKSLGSQDIFVARFDKDSKIDILLSAGGKGTDLVSCLAMGPNDNLILGGVISDSVSFGKTKIAHTGRQLFVSKTDSKGSFSWVSTFTMTGDASLTMIGSDRNGTIFATGVFSGYLEAEGQKVTSTSKKDIFLACLSNNGVVEKLISFGSPEDDFPSSLSVDPSGGIVLAGVYSKPFELGQIKLTPGPKGTKTSVFMVSFDKDLNAKWSNLLTGEDYLEISSLKHDNQGNFYATGSFNSKLHVVDTVLVSNGYTDGFILKYTPEGKLLWAKDFGSWYYDYANNINVDNLGGAIVTGSLGDTLTIDSLSVEPLTRNNSALVIQFSPDGRATWADCISGTGRNFSTGAVLDKNGNLYFTGSFRNKFEKGSDVLTSYGDQDVFLARYYNCPGLKAEIFGQPYFCSGSSTELSVKRGFTNIVWNDTLTGKYSILANKPGNYWVRMLDKKGCILTDTIKVERHDLPFFSLGNDTSILVIDSLLLQAPEKYSRYIWHDYSYQPSFLAKSVNRTTGTEKYWLTVTDSASCIYTDTISITYLKWYDWKDPGKVQLVTYPNPANDKIYWYLKTSDACQFVMELTDVNGRVLNHQLIKQYIPGEVKEMDLKSFPSGIYNIRISNPSSEVDLKTVRFIKK